MKTIYFKIIVLLVIVGGVNLILSSFVYKKFTPYYWGNQAITDKRNFIKSSGNEYDVLFVGSSKTYHQINPLVFDSIVDPRGKIHSFNYGIQSLLPPESFYILENLLLNDSINCKYILMELNWFSNLKMKDLHTRRNYYWLSPRSYSFSLNSTLNSNIPISYKGWSLASRTVNLVDKVYNIGIYNEITNYYSKENDNTGMKTLELEKYQGFKPVNRDTGVTITNEYEERLSKDLEEVKYASKASFEKYDKLKTKDLYYNKVYYNYLENLISVAKQRGIHLIFIMPPQWKTYQYDELIPIFEHLPKENKIVVADVRRYPSLFEIENLFDADHLNEKGSRIITELIAKEFKSIRDSNGKFQ